MKIQVRINEGKIVQNREKLSDMFTSAITGDYIVHLDLISPSVTRRDYQKLYFDRIDAATKCSSVGYTRYELHEMFKEHCELSSTKDLDEAGWKGVIEKLRWWLFSNFDCMV